MSLTFTAIEATQAMMAVPMSGAWVPWPAGDEPAFIGNLRTNLDTNTALKDIFKTIGVVIMIVWVAYILAKIAMPGKGGGGARQIQWVGVILGLMVAGICLNLEALPNILSVVLLAGSSLMEWVGLA